MADVNAPLSAGTLFDTNKKPATPVKPVEKAAVKDDKAVATKPVDPKGMFDWSDCKQHKAAEGETLYDIAQKYCVALQQLRYFNHINKTTMHIRIGQTIYIPNKPIKVPYGK